jgi:hypothetical protein
MPVKERQKAPLYFAKVKHCALGKGVEIHIRDFADAYEHPTTDKWVNTERTEK